MNVHWIKRIMAVIRFASTPKVDTTALVKKVAMCWQVTTGLVKVCVHSNNNNTYVCGEMCMYRFLKG